MSENIKCEYDNDSLIPEGKYNAKCIKSEINNRFRGKVKLELKIISGKYNGTIVARHYNVYRAKKPGPDGEGRDYLEKLMEIIRTPYLTENAS